MDSSPEIALMKKNSSTISVVKNFFHEFRQSSWFFVALTANIIGHILYSFDAYVVSQIVDNLRHFLA
jgi:hypothetical protein